MGKAEPVSAETREALARLERLHAAGAISKEERDRRKGIVLKAVGGGAARLGVVLVVACALLALAGVGISRAAQTYYASPTGTGVECTQAVPCEFAEAYSKALDGDSVVLEPGTYTLGEALEFNHSISFGGEPGQAAQTVIKTTTFKDVFTLPGAHPELHDLKLEGSGTLVLSSGSADRIIVAYTGAEAACALVGSPTATVLSDSVCWAHGASDASAILASIGSGNGRISIGHVTAVSSAAGGEGLHATAATGSHLGVQVTNSIVEGDGIDIEAAGAAGSKTTVALGHSNFDSITTQNPSAATITPVGAPGDQTAQPHFISVAEADFREALDSATVDAGETTPTDGPLALGGEPRVSGECGAPAAPDIGAYEVVTAPCTTAPVETVGAEGSGSPSGGAPVSTTPAGSTPTTPVLAPSIRVVKVLKAKRGGTAVLLVDVPGPGRLALAGEGVRATAVAAAGAGQVRLPVRTTGSTRRRLIRPGGVAVHLGVTFTATDGGTASATRTLRLQRGRARRGH